MKDIILKARNPHEENKENIVILFFVLHMCVNYLRALFISKFGLIGVQSRHTLRHISRIFSI